MTQAILHRGIVSASGADARSFLQGLVSSDMDKVTAEAAGFGALLTPQGKILFDFFIFQTDDGFLLDCPPQLTGDLVKRLGLYKLRAKVVIADVSQHYHVRATWNEPAAPGLADPRSPALGHRLIAPGAAAPENEPTYQELRIRAGIAEGGLDYVYGDTFPHEANFDRTHGVDFAKGCYVGQEVVSRMQHKSVVRKRVVPVRFDGAPLPSGADILSGEQVIGRMGSSVPGLGLALLRLDRAAEATQLLCAGRPLTLVET